MENHFLFGSTPSEEVKEYKMDTIFGTHGIIKEKVDCFRNFTYRLIHHLYSTYFGPEYIFKNSDAKNHFNWCFNKTVEEFQNIDIDFSNNKALYTLFYNYFIKYLYTYEDYSEEREYKYYKFINYEKKNKTALETEKLIDIYNIFNKSFDVKINENEHSI